MSCHEYLCLSTPGRNEYDSGFGIVKFDDIRDDPGMVVSRCVEREVIDRGRSVVVAVFILYADDLGERKRD